MSIADAAARDTALDLRRSFCVSAPAGSGKTELLIQRYLGLLSRVSRPEQVLAITFTRKAAAEMRERVMQALQAARGNEPVASDHEGRTRSLAVAALAADEQYAWGLLRDISRLNIRTIDGFCGHLTRQMPVLSAFGGPVAILDEPSELYLEAVTELFGLLGTEHAIAADLGRLMLHFDNNWERLQDLLIAMLARREQWRDYVGVHHQPQEAEAYLRRTVQAVVEDSLANLALQLAPFAGELSALQDYAAANLNRPPPSHLPDSTAEDLPQWRELQQLLLTKEGIWRKTVTKAQGFPAGKGTARDHKDRMLRLLDELRTQPELQVALAEVSQLPVMTAESDAWQLVLQLSHVLPLLAAQLLVVFQSRGVVDHSQVAMSALQALGDDEAPTDLALRLDYLIEHLLVDEFQDTAINQFELVRRLTRGWEQHNALNPTAPRTLLIVGDAMQSIYGFRDANVGLFLRARDEGFNGIVPEYLELQCNFRSETGVIEWNNAVFRGAFPASDNIQRSEVSFRDALAIKPASTDDPVTVHAFYGEAAETREVAFICDQIQQALSTGNGDASAADSIAADSIAILGRSRPQLQAVMAGLKTAGIAYYAPGVDRLSGSAVIVDLMSLCRALANRADRLAWAAMLRAPWCGLLLADVLRVCRYGEPARHTALGAALTDEQLLASLSADGAQRARRLAAALGQAERYRDRLALRVWVEQLWFRLGGAAAAVNSAELTDAERFFQLLETADGEGRGLDIDWLELKLAGLYVDAGTPDAPVQVMTLHKAKGLEFDWVFIPALARGTRSDARPLLMWDEYSGASIGRGFLLAADDHSQPDVAGLYNYLRQQRKRKAQLESTRLLYVGATRAIRRLVLTASLGYDDAKEELREPPAATLLARIWPQVQSQLKLHPPEAIAASDATSSGPPGLRRLAQMPAFTESPITTAATTALSAAGKMPPPTNTRQERAVGTAVHWLLEQLAARSPLPSRLEESQILCLQWQLQRLGLHGEELSDAMALARKAVARSLADATGGRWLLDARHPEGSCELRLTRLDEASVIGDIVIDRTFIDRSTGERWIVDYKTGGPLVGELAADFCQREAQNYRQQLSAYRDALRQLGPQRIRCALYFTTLGLLHELPELDSAGR